jgi:hypothetical protein
MKRTAIILGSFLILSFLKAQPSKAYLMSYFTCTNCTTPVNHSVRLAESNDGVNWTSVPGFTTYTGSVPDVITRGNKMYIYTPGLVRRYNYTTNTWEVNAVQVNVKDENNVKVDYVDPSLTVDGSGNLVMIFLESTGLQGDPAVCTTYPCTKQFRTATEVAGSDGQSFITNAGNRISINLSSAGSSASDPDIYYDGTNYVCYISKGNNIALYTSPTLHGTYTQSSLPNGILTTEGGIPSGYYDPVGKNYWTYVHIPQGEIKLKVHPTLNSQITGFNTIITNTLAGGTGASCQSPGFCKNTLSLSTAVNNVSIAQTGWKCSQNSSVGSVLELFKKSSINSKIQVRLFDISGALLHTGNYQSNRFSIDISQLNSGSYVVELIEGNQKSILKFIK